MDSFLQFIELFTTQPMFALFAVLTIGVILVNGWTDAPNAIASCVATRAMHPRVAIIMAAVFNFLGVFVMTLISNEVAATVFNIADFGTNTHDAQIAVCAAMFAIVTWAVAAWAFGIPTSESHALIAGITGAAIALHGNMEGVSGAEWLKVGYGLVLSLVIGFVLSYGITKLLQYCCRNLDYRKASKWFGKGQIAASAGMAFMHGAQDGQKFMGIFMLGFALSNGTMDASTFTAPVWLMVLCSVVMGLGTSIGGMKIIKSVGMDMVKMEKYQGFVADTASTLSLFTCSLLGMPVSTTHAKTTSIMGVGAAKRLRSVNWGVAKEMVLTWVFTFPGCGLIGFLMTKLFMLIF